MPGAAWQIVSEIDGGILDVTDTLFALRNDPLSFYVNDAVFDGDDEYTSAIGTAGNHGDLSSAPKDSIQAIIDTYDLEPGDTVFIDDGTYAESILVDEFDAGSGTNLVTFRGVVGDGGTSEVSAVSSYGFEFNDAPSMAIQYMTIRSAPSAGVHIDDSDSCDISWVDVTGGSSGFEIVSSIGTEFDHCVVQSASEGVKLSSTSSSTTFENGVLYGNTTGVRESGWQH